MDPPGRPPSRWQQPACRTWAEAERAALCFFDRHPRELAGAPWIAIAHHRWRLATGDLTKAGLPQMRGR